MLFIIVVKKMNIYILKNLLEENTTGDLGNDNQVIQLRSIWPLGTASERDLDCAEVNGICSADLNGNWPGSQVT